jgi:predicted nuclease of predicted toxin-antitoxin system
MKILVDACLSPDWVVFFAEHGVDCIHWTTIGACDAEDSVIFSYALDGCWIIFTHDLDFGTLLAQTKSNGPSVIQARVEDPTPESIGFLVLQLLKQFQSELLSGAIVTLAANKRKVRVLPI